MIRWSEITYHDHFLARCFSIGFCPSCLTRIALFDEVLVALGAAKIEDLFIKYTLYVRSVCREKEEWSKGHYMAERTSNATERHVHFDLTIALLPVLQYVRSYRRTSTLSDIMARVCVLTLPLLFSYSPWRHYGRRLYHARGTWDRCKSSIWGCACLTMLLMTMTTMDGGVCVLTAFGSLLLYIMYVLPLMWPWSTLQWLWHLLWFFLFSSKVYKDWCRRPVVWYVGRAIYVCLCVCLCVVLLSSSWMDWILLLWWTMRSSLGWWRGPLVLFYHFIDHYPNLDTHFAALDKEDKD